MSASHGKYVECSCSGKKRSIKLTLRWHFHELEDVISHGNVSAVEVAKVYTPNQTPNGSVQYLLLLQRTGKLQKAAHNSFHEAFLVSMENNQASDKNFILDRNSWIQRGFDEEIKHLCMFAKHITYPAREEAGKSAACHCVAITSKYINQLLMAQCIHCD